MCRKMRRPAAKAKARARAKGVSRETTTILLLLFLRQMTMTTTRMEKRTIKRRPKSSKDITATRSRGAIPAVQLSAQQMLQMPAM